MRSSNAVITALIALASDVASTGTAVAADSPVDSTRNDFVMPSSVSAGPTFSDGRRATAYATEPLGERLGRQVQSPRRFRGRRAAEQEQEQIPLASA